MTSPQPLVVIGAGGHAKVIIELIRDLDAYEIVGLVDADPTPRSVLGVPVLGNDTRLESLRREGVRHAFPALGDNRRRFAVARTAAQEGFGFVNAVSRAAVLSASVRLGRGVAIMAGAVVNADCEIADFAIVNTRASVDHDCRIGEAAHVGPGAALAGNVTIGRLAFLGVGTSAIPGVSIGEGAVVGAGACVVRDIPPGTLARGIPAKVVDHELR